MNQLLALLLAHPEVTAVLLFLIATGLHVAVGAALHAFRLHDFDWGKLGMFVEQDWATKRGIAILATFLTTLATNLGPNADWRAAYVPAFLALAASCASATLPIARDTLYELVYLVSGFNPAAGRLPASATQVVATHATTGPPVTWTR